MELPYDFINFIFTYYFLQQRFYSTSKGADALLKLEHDIDEATSAAKETIGKYIDSI